MKKVFIFSMLALILISGIYSPQILQAQTESNPYDAIMASYSNTDGPGYAIQINKDGKTIYQKAFGKADLEMNVDMKPNHIFRIGSITKQFTAVCILKLMEEGQLDLQDDLNKYWPDFPSNGNRVTIEHLLTHTSGIKSYTSMEKWDMETRKKDFTPVELIQYFKDEPMDFEPGQKFSYNNSGYILLGYIIEKVSGMSYADYLKENIFKPLGMENSHYGNHSTIIKNRANGYAKNDEGNLINAPFLSMTQPYAAGSILSTTEDLAKWNRAVMGGKVISLNSLEKAHTPYVLEDGSKTSYGYGWGIGDLKGSKAIRHSGGINGFLSAGVYFPQEKVTVIALSNCNCNPPDHFFMKLAAQAIDKPIEAPKKIEVSQEQLDQYVGVYALGSDFNITINKKEGKLYGAGPGQPEIELLPVREHGFIIEQIDAKILFHLNDQKEIDGLTLYQNGEHNAKKIE